MMKSVAILAYTAGIVDGEGNICIAKQNKYNNSKIELRVTNTNEWLPQWLKMQFGGRVYLMKDSSRKPNAKDGFRWRVTARQAGKVLELLLPYLQIKKPQAEIALSFQKRRKSPSNKISETTKALDERDKLLMSQYNHRGK